MDDQFGKYLMSYIHRADLSSHHDDKRNKCMVIIESRDCFWLPLVIRNAIDKCSIRGDFKASNIDTTDIKDIKNYNLLLTGESFWERFAEEHIIVFQLDSIFLREPKVEEYSDDFLGAVCGQAESENSFVVNGGFSYRSKSAMIRACREMEFKRFYRTMAEDVLFTDVLRRGNYRFPTMQRCNDFAIETIGNCNTCIGVHGTDKYYLGRQTKIALEPFLSLNETLKNQPSCFS